MDGGFRYLLCCDCVVIAMAHSHRGDRAWRSVVEMIERAALQAQNGDHGLGIHNRAIDHHLIGIVHRHHTHVGTRSLRADFLTGSRGKTGGEEDCGVLGGIARRVHKTGELRKLGADFDVEVVHTLDERMRGEIIIVFSVDESIANGQPHPLSFGNFIWAPDMVMTANISRNGGYSRETVVQPRYSFIVNCPIMISLKVTGWTEAFNKKIPLHTLGLTGSGTPVNP